MAELLFEPIPHADAAKFISSKPVVSREVFYKLLPELRARAFVISGVTSADVVRDIRDKIATLPEGADWEDVKKDMVNDLHPYLASEEDPDNTIAAEKRAELLLRMHGFQAYQTAACEVMDRQRDVFPFWQYKTMGDGAVRPAHAALDGIVLPADHEFWATHTPPWDFGCRCQIIPISQDDHAEISAADEKRAPDQQLVLDDDSQKELTTTRRLVRNGVTYNMSAPSEKGKEGAYQWNPGEIGFSLADLRGRYDEKTFSDFSAWAKKTTIPEQGKTVWDWLNRKKAQGINE